MKNSKEVLLTGVRDSALSVAQSQFAIDKLNNILATNPNLSALRFELKTFSSPGDRDQTTDLRVASADFFSKDLDQALLNNEIDCAIHSAKDLAEFIEDVDENLDIMYLPWHEDKRDAIVLAKDKTFENLPANPVVGISSQRRSEYLESRFNGAVLKNIRGNINRRLEQLDNGDYDLLIMAVAALNRLNMAERISEIIPLESLNVPYGQGILALTFRKGDKFFQTLRQAFVKKVTFASAGIGSIKNTTLGVIESLKSCEVCLYDALCPQELLKFLPADAEQIFVGKRMGQHSKTQAEISNLIMDLARKGRKVVRLKGGDAGIFGRLAEEIKILDDYKLPYQVLSGVSSLSVATTCTGLLTTRRDINRGFTVATPRRADSSKLEWFNHNDYQNFTKIFFMGVSEINNICKQLRVVEGYLETTPIAVVFEAGTENEEIISGTLADISSKIDDVQSGRAGLIIVGETAKAEYIYQNHGPLKDKKILFTGSSAIAQKAKNLINEYGGKFYNYPMIELKEKEISKEEILNILDKDTIIIPSPSLIVWLVEKLKKEKISLNRLPKIAVCGTGSSELLATYGLYADITATYNFGADGLVAEISKLFNETIDKSKLKIGRLKSDIAPSKLADNLKLAGFENVEEFVVVENSSANYLDDEKAHKEVKNCDAILFCSPSAVESYVKNFGEDLLKNRHIIVIGEPTKKCVSKYLNENVIKSKEATIQDMIEDYIYFCTARRLK